MDDTEERQATEPGGYAGMPGAHVTANQVVAWNLLHFRKAAGHTQEELGEMLGWSPAVVSAAERSWDGRRVRQFTADDLAAIAAALGIPVPALFLPPEDDGVSTRYLIDVPGAAATEVQVANTCWDMATLMNYAMSEPSDEDTPAAERYRQRYAAALRAYLGADHVAERAGYDLTSEELARDRLAELREQYTALRGILADNDHQQQALEQRLRGGKGGQ